MSLCWHVIFFLNSNATSLQSNSPYKITLRCFRDCLSPIKLSSRSLAWHARPLELASGAVTTAVASVLCFLLHVLTMASYAEPHAWDRVGTSQIFDKATASSFPHTPACFGGVNWDCKATQRLDLEISLYDMLGLKAFKAMGSYGRALSRGMT